MFNQKIIVDCSKPKKEQITLVDLAPEEIEQFNTRITNAQEKQTLEDTKEQNDIIELQNDLQTIRNATTFNQIKGILEKTIQERLDTKSNLNRV